MGVSDHGVSTDFLSAPSLADWATAISNQVLAGPLLDGTGVDVTNNLIPPTYVEGRWWLHPKYGSPAAVGFAHGVTTAAGATTARCSVVLPPGILDGQVLVAFVIYANATGTTAAATLGGWTLRGTVIQGAQLTTAILTKVGAASDSSTTVEFNMTVATATRMAVSVVVCDRVTVTGMPTPTQATETVGTGGAHVTPTIAAGAAGLLLEMVCERPGSIVSNSYTVASPVIKLDDFYVISSTSLTFVTGSKPVTIAGTEGGHTYTSSGGTQANAQQLTVFLPGV